VIRARLTPDLQTKMKKDMGIRLVMKGRECNLCLASQAEEIQVGDIELSPNICANQMKVYQLERRPAPLRRASGMDERGQSYEQDYEDVTESMARYKLTEGSSRLGPEVSTGMYSQIFLKFSANLEQVTMSLIKFYQARLGEKACYHLMTRLVSFLTAFVNSTQ
jgi:hypothetical protein